MLDEFITQNRNEIVTRARSRFVIRTHRDNEALLGSAIPTFVDQLCDALRLAKSSAIVDHDQISARAARHGRDLLRMGFTIAQVVHDYGDVCQVVTELAEECTSRISGEEFRILNLCLDDAIAGAVTEYSNEHDRTMSSEGTERLGILAHELRNHLNAAVLAFGVIKSGQVAPSGSTAAVVDRSLNGIRDLVDRSLADVRLAAGIQTFSQIRVADFLQEIEIGAALQAQDRGIHLVVHEVPNTVEVAGDRQLLAAALANLLQNAFKFTRRGGRVKLTTHVTDERVAFDVEDECGGLPAGEAEALFRPFEQRSADRSGLGLGLTICLKVAKTHAGELRVRDIPAKGCVFTLDLPRHGK